MSLTRTLYNVVVEAILQYCKNGVLFSSLLSFVLVQGAINMSKLDLPLSIISTGSRLRLKDMI